MPRIRAMVRPIRAAMLAAVLSWTGVAAALAQPAAPEPTPAAPTWIPFQDALRAADSSGKMVLVDVWSRRCGWCARMQRETYTEPEVLRYLNAHFETGRLDIDIRADTVAYMGYELSSAELSAALGASGTPTTVFLDRDGTYVTRLPGFHPADRFLDVLHYMGTASYRDMSFEEYQDQAAPDRND